MAKEKTAFDIIKETYSIETLREIEEYNQGGSAGIAKEHSFHSQTVPFFDQFEDEICEYISDIMGREHLEEIWCNNPCNLIGYKNDCVWCFIDLVATEVIEEYEQQNSSKKD